MVYSMTMEEPPEFSLVVTLFSREEKKKSMLVPIFLSLRKPDVIQPYLYLLKMNL